MTGSARFLSLLLISLSCLHCGDDADPSDAGMSTDTGVVADTGAARDSGAPDLGAADTGGAVDSGAVDTGVAIDAGADAGVPTDAGGPTDSGGMADAGTPSDAGTPDGSACVGRGPSRPDSGIVYREVYGTDQFDDVSGVTVDGLGALYVVGATSGAFSGAIDLPFGDGYIQKRDALTGAVDWSYQIGTSSTDGAFSVAVGSVLGTPRVMVAGNTAGAFAGASNGGGFDGYVARVTDTGGVRDTAWVHQFGSSEDEYVFGLDADSLGSSYVVGRTSGDLVVAVGGVTDAFLRVVSPSGAASWTQQIDYDKADVALGVAANLNDNAVYVVGGSGDSLFAPTATSAISFIHKYNAATGDLVWAQTTNTFGAAGVATDLSTGDVYVSGTVRSQLGCGHFGDRDGIIIKYDSTGSVIWTHQFGESTPEFAGAIALSPGPVVSVTGSGFGGHFVHKVDGLTGQALWTEVIGTSVIPRDVTMDPAGNVYTVSYTSAGAASDPIVSRLVP